MTVDRCVCGRFVGDDVLCAACRERLDNTLLAAAYLVTLAALVRVVPGAGALREVLATAADTAVERARANSPG